MEGFVARADLVPPDRLKELSQRSDGRGLARLAAHSAMLAVTGYGVWLAGGTWWLAPAMVVHGIVIAFLFCAHHEFIHRTVFRARRLNDWAAAATGFVILYEPYYFRRFHYDHHRYTQDPARDPELLAPPPASRGAYLWRASGLPFWRRQVQNSLAHAFLGRADHPFVRPRDVPTIVAEARWMWAGYVLVAAASVGFESWLAVQYWIAPIVLGHPFLRLYLMAEHAGLPFTEDMLANTRTMLTNPVVRRLAWNMPYHVEHHVFPAVPCYALPAVHAIIRDRLQVVEPGYIATHAGLWRGLARHPAALQEN